MIPYPKYTKSEDLRCKLTEKDIVRIRLRKRIGATTKELAKDFNVCPMTICYWINADRREAVIERNKRFRCSKKKQKIYAKKFRERKKELKPTYLQYMRELIREVYKNRKLEATAK